MAGNHDQELLFVGCKLLMHPFDHGYQMLELIMRAFVFRFHLSFCRSSSSQRRLRTSVIIPVPQWSLGNELTASVFNCRKKAGSWPAAWVFDMLLKLMYTATARNEMEWMLEILELGFVRGAGESELTRSLALQQQLVSSNSLVGFLFLFFFFGSPQRCTSYKTKEGP